jgi:DNA-binding CsgD family transcriptional regulator
VVAGADAAWLDLVADLMAAPLLTLPAERIAATLMDTLRAGSCAASVEEVGGVIDGVIHPVDEDFGCGHAVVEQWCRDHARDVHPVVLQYRRTGSLSLVQCSEVPEQVVAAREQARWREVARPWGAHEQLVLPLPPHAGGRRAFALGRDLPWSGREMELARRVLRLLTGLDRQVRALAGQPPRADVAAELRLTPRQLAVLGLLADGLTAAAIARRLGIAERTVHKHLEAVYDRIGVHDRLGAVLRARDLGLLPAAAVAG